MATASDILKELEDIGAVGGKVVAPVARKVFAPPVPFVPIVPVVTAEEEHVPSSPPKVNKVLVGFADQLELLEGALKGMLSWCALAREQLLQQAIAADGSQPEPSYEPQPELDFESAQGSLPAEEEASETAPDKEPVPEAASEPVAASVSRPMKSIEEIKAQFFESDSEFATRRLHGSGNGVASTSIPVPAVDPIPKTEGTNG